jgi:hypothetical protein
MQGLTREQLEAKGARPVTASTTPNKPQGMTLAQLQAMSSQGSQTPAPAPAPTSIGRSVGNFLGGATFGFSAPGRTIQNALSSGVDRLFGTKNFGRASQAGFEQVTKTDVDTTPGKAGQFVGEAATFLVPGSAAAQATAKSPFLVKTAVQGAASFAQGVLNEGEVNSDAVAAGAAAAAGPALGAGVRLTGRIASNVTKNIAAVLSGKGTKVIDAIIENPQAARQGMRETIGIAQSAQQVRNGVKKLADTAAKEFETALDELPKRLGRAPSVLTAGKKTTIKVGGKTYTLSTQGIKSNLTKMLRRFNVEVDPRKETFDFLEAPLDNAESARLREVFNVVQEWRDTSPAGLHRLSRKISNFRRPGEQSKELNAIIDAVSKGTHDYIAKRIPAAREMLTKYSQAQDVIEAFDQEFATSGRFMGGIAERIKTERKLGTLFSGEKTSAVGLLENKLPGGKDVVGREAGRLLSEDIGRSAASIGDMLRSVVNTVISPRLVGEVAAATGLAKPVVEQILQRAQTLAPAARAAYIQTISEAISSGSQQQSTPSEPQ